jgi:hypothetical protein
MSFTTARKGGFFCLFVQMGDAFSARRPARRVLLTFAFATLEQN